VTFILKKEISMFIQQRPINLRCVSQNQLLTESATLLVAMQFANQLSC